MYLVESGGYLTRIDQVSKPIIAFQGSIKVISDDVVGECAFRLLSQLPRQNVCSGFEIVALKNELKRDARRAHGLETRYRRNCWMCMASL